VLGLVDAAVDGPTEVLDKRAVEARIYLADPEIGIHLDLSRLHVIEGFPTSG
jgi:hypothetical protein